MNIKSSQLSHKGKTIAKSILANNGKKFDLAETMAQLDKILESEKKNK